MKKIEFNLDGHSHSGFAQLIGDQIWMHFAGRTFSVPNQTSQQNSGRKNSHKTALKSGTIVSPMPGKITKILVKVGDSVDENQNILVMEAMKMEYSLKTNVCGIVKEICFTANAQVTLGATLAIVEKVTPT